MHFITITNCVFKEGKREKAGKTELRWGMRAGDGQGAGRHPAAGPVLFLYLSAGCMSVLNL